VAFTFGLLINARFRYVATWNVEYTATFGFCLTGPFSKDYSRLGGVYL